MKDLIKMIWNGASGMSDFVATEGMTLNEVEAWATANWPAINAVMNTPPPASVQAAMNQGAGGVPMTTTGGTATGGTTTVGPACPTGTNCAATGGPTTGA